MSIGFGLNREGVMDVLSSIKQNTSQQLFSLKSGTLASSHTTLRAHAAMESGDSSDETEPTVSLEAEVQKTEGSMHQLRTWYPTPPTYKLWIFLALLDRSHHSAIMFALACDRILPILLYFLRRMREHILQHVPVELHQMLSPHRRNFLPTTLLEYITVFHISRRDLAQWPEFVSRTTERRPQLQSLLPPAYAYLPLDLYLQEQ